jgi:hypothetical protein
MAEQGSDRESQEEGLSYWKARKQLRRARTQAELAWLHGEKELVEAVFLDAKREGHDPKTSLQDLLASPLAPAFPRGDIPDLESRHEKFLDKWRIGITLVLVVALAVVVWLVVKDNNNNSAAAPYVSLLSGLAGIALGWMFANATGGSRGADHRSPNDGTTQH